MTRYISRVSAVLALVASMALSAAPALAGGGYDWTDISDKIAERTNRPVWAMAYASPYWYLTDGQELWSGGHVWRTEGSAMADITNDVRNAGISRVDDIVSDGQTVLFLKGITAKNNSFQVIKYNGSYSDASYTLRNQLNSDEGIISLKGKDGMWAFVTSKGRVLLWNTGSNNVTSILSSTVNYPDFLNYSVYGTSPSQQYMFFAFAVPVSNGWFIGQTQSGPVNMRMWLRDNNGNLTDITSKFGAVEGIEFIASNGNAALITTRYTYAHSGPSRQLYSFDGTTLTSLSTQYSNADVSFNWSRAIAANDGSSWLVIERGGASSERSALLVDGSTITKLTDVKDYFIDMASNGNGTILLGGAESQLGQTDPTNPLTLKLVKATNSNTTTGNTNNSSGSFGGGKTYSSYSGPNLTTSGNPSDYEVGNGETFVYRATASDSNGIDRIELFANSARVQTCYADTCEYSNIYYTNGLSTRAVPLSAKAYDRYGNATESSNENLTVNQTGSNSNTGNGQISGQSGNTYFWTWTEPNNATYLKRGDSLTFNVGASDADGLKRIEIFANGTLKRTCDYSTAYGNQTCSATLYGNDYSLNSQVAVNARITDSTSAEAWPTMQYLTVQDSSYSGNTTGDISTWGWFDPSSSSLNRGSSTTFKVQASATQGLQRIEVYADGSLKRTCDFSRAYATQNCDLNVYANDYTIAQHSFNAKATDYNGKTAWSDSKTITVQDNGSTNSGDISTWTWLDPSGSTLNRNSNATFRVQSTANQGLNSIEVYVNGNLKRTCSFSRSYGTQNCDLTIYGTDYSNGSVLSLNAKATDYNGKTAWSDNKSLTIQDNGTGSSVNGSVGLQANPDKTYFNNGDQVTFNGSSQDPDGLQRIEILKDGSLAKTCYYSNSTNWETCAYTTNVYSDGSNTKTFNVSVNAYDRYGYARGVNPITYYVYGQGGSNTNGTGDYPATWSWSEPNENLTVSTNGSAVYHVGAWDNDGLNRIEIYVNGILAHNCNFGTYTAYGNQECQFTLNGGNYKNGDQVYVNAKAVDAQSREGWANARTYSITSGSTSYNNQSSWVWSDPSVSEITGSQNVTFFVGAWAQNGIRKIEIIGNGAVMKTCDLGFSAYGNQQCSVAVATSYPGTTYANYSGRITDGNGNVFNSDTKSYTILNAPTQTTNDVGGTVSMTSDHDGGYGASDLIRFSANGQDSDGIDRLELMVNGRLVKVCYTGTCSWTGGPYPDRASVTYGARLVDSKGHAYFTGYKTIYKK